MTVKYLYMLFSVISCIPFSQSLTFLYLNTIHTRKQGSLYVDAQCLENLAVLVFCVKVEPDNLYPFHEQFGLLKYVVIK